MRRFKASSGALGMGYSVDALLYLPQRKSPYLVGRDPDGIYLLAKH